MPNAKVNVFVHILGILIVSIFITLAISRFLSIWQVLGHGILHFQMFSEKSTRWNLDIRENLQDSYKLKGKRLVLD